MSLHKIKSLLSHKGLQDHSMFFVATTLANCINFVYHFLMGRILGPVDFGTFTTLFSFFYIMFGFMSTLQSSVAQSTGTLLAKNLEAEEKEQFASILSKIILGGGVVSLILLALSPFIASKLALPLSGVIIVVIALIPAFLYAVYRGRLQGAQRFFGLGRVLIGESFVKLGLGLALVFVGFGVQGALLAVLAGYICATLLSWPHVLPKRPSEKHSLFRKSIPVLIATAALTATYSLDVVIARLYLPDAIAGQYAAISLVGRIMFFATNSIPQVLFAQSIANAAKGASSEKAYKLTLLANVSIVFGATLFLWILGPYAIPLVLGTAYTHAAAYAFYIAFGMGALSVASLVVYHDIAYAKKSSLVILAIGVAVEIALLPFFSASLESLVRYHGFALLLLSLVLVVRSLFFQSRHGSQTPAQVV